ncbi:MAG: DUF2147 domain-containing protein [Methylibium sp.]|uniref:DUF2147 domain-containing protein n=1 Tax=Methylibium sp. TaxID=2067992 RepID=UPI0018508B04|nr:DUF2147 domain-containing protein [Methylibium sp.]MBA3597900.1 DUF2147 domain-containing protein [Methylibium sp.]
MMKLLAAGAFAMLGAFLPLAHAQAPTTPVGLWKTIDDDTKEEKSLVRISESGGVLSGKIEKLLAPKRQDSTCDKCSDELKDKPIAGMTIINGVKQNADDATRWDGGEILDPNNGKTYKVRLKPIEGGKKLEVRGYIGSPLLGRTQTWVRVE